MCDLSVIMPIYNVAAFLDEAIEAILTEKTCSMEQFGDMSRMN